MQNGSAIAASALCFFLLWNKHRLYTFLMSIKLTVIFRKRFYNIYTVKRIGFVLFCFKKAYLLFHSVVFIYGILVFWCTDAQNRGNFFTKEVTHWVNEINMLWTFQINSWTYFQSTLRNHFQNERTFRQTHKISILWAHYNHSQNIIGMVGIISHEIPI